MCFTFPMNKSFPLQNHNVEIIVFLRKLETCFSPFLGRGVRRRFPEVEAFLLT